MGRSLNYITRKSVILSRGDNKLPIGERELQKDALQALMLKSSIFLKKSIEKLAASSEKKVQWCSLNECFVQTSKK